MPQSGLHGKVDIINDFNITLKWSGFYSGSTLVPSPMRDKTVRVLTLLLRPQLSQQRPYVGGAIAPLTNQEIATIWDAGSNTRTTSLCITVHIGRKGATYRRPKCMVIYIRMIDMDSADMAEQTWTSFQVSDVITFT